jgi:hypothetical protein
MSVIEHTLSRKTRVPALAMREPDGDLAAGLNGGQTSCPRSPRFCCPRCQ